MKVGLLIAPALALAFVAPRPAMAACEAARVTSDVAPLPAAWRRALDDLVVATAREGLPWSCGGAEIALTLGADGALLTVSMRSFPVQTRALARADDLVPTGKALLSRPAEPRAAEVAALPAPAAPADPTVAAGSSALDRATPPPAPQTEPRLLVSVLASTRFSDRANAFWAGATARATLPFGPWSAGVWARYEVAFAEQQPMPVDFSMSSGSVGASGGYRFLASPIALSVAIEPSLAVISMDGGVDSPKESADGARIDFRLGARLAGAVPLGRVRGVFALDGEVSPGAFASEKHATIDPRLPRIPGFTVGASLGAEFAVR